MIIRINPAKYFAKTIFFAELDEKTPPFGSKTYTFELEFWGDPPPCAQLVASYQLKVK